MKVKFRTGTARLLFFTMVVLFATHSAWALNSRVVLAAGGRSEAFLQKVEYRLSLVVTSLTDGGFDTLGSFFDSTALRGFRTLRDSSRCKNTDPQYTTQLLTLPDGNYEVRDIRVETQGRGIAYLVFTMNGEGSISDVRFALEDPYYREIIRPGEKLADAAKRQAILSFVERYRTAYDKKDTTYIAQVLSDHAIIVVGRVIQSSNRDAPARLTASRSEIQLLVENKRQYLDNLKKAFAANEYIRVYFDSITVFHHPDHPDFYAVNLAQGWKSPHYKDHGYLFLLLEMRQLDTDVGGQEFMINVRSWQSEKFPDGTVMDAGRVEIVE